MKLRKVSPEKRVEQRLVSGLSTENVSYIGKFGVYFILFNMKLCVDKINVQKLVGRKFQKYMPFIVKQYIPTYKIYTSVIPLTILSLSTGVVKTLLAQSDASFELNCSVSP